MTELQPAQHLLLHQLHQLPIAAHHVILHLVRGDLAEKLSGTLDF